jgi:hypothetical protein
MPSKIGTIIDAVNLDPNPNGSGEPAGDSNTDAGFRAPGGAPNDQPKSESSFIHGDDIFEPIDSAGSDAGAPAGESAGPKRRGRKPGWRKAVEQTPVPPNLADIDFGAIMLQAHQMLAALTIPELEIERKEADKLTAALKAALKFHPAGISPEKLAYINLGMVAVEVYGSRTLAWRMRIAQEKAQRRPAVPMGPVRAPTGAPAPAQAGAPAGPAAPIRPAASQQGTGTFGPSLCEPASEGTPEP